MFVCKTFFLFFLLLAQTTGCRSRIAVSTQPNLSNLAAVSIAKVDRRQYPYDNIQLKLTSVVDAAKVYTAKVDAVNEESTVKTSVPKGDYLIDLTYLRGEEFVLGSKFCSEKPEPFALKPRSEVARNVIKVRICKSNQVTVEESALMPIADPELMGDVDVVPAVEEKNGVSSIIAGQTLSDIQVLALQNILARRGDGLIGGSHALAYVLLEPSSSDPEIVKISKKNHDILTQDGENALIYAALFAHNKDKSYAKKSAEILLDWAQVNRSFSGKNGFLASAWAVGAMARAARILQEHQSEEWVKIKAPFTEWVAKTAVTYWLPSDPSRPLNGAKPQLMNSWELSNVSNRTFTALEATLHVAYLVGDDMWFKRGIELYKQIVPKFFAKQSGEHADQFRIDDWHLQAGLASAAQICQLAKRKGFDLFSYDNNALLRSSEFYAERIKSQYIPFWPIILNNFGADTAPKTAALMAKDHGSYYGWYIHGVEFIWGLPQFL